MLPKSQILMSNFTNDQIGYVNETVENRTQSILEGHFKFVEEGI